MNVMIYHNPKCSKSRETLNLIKKNGIEPLVVEYLKNTPGFMELNNIIKMLGIKPRELLRTKEAAYKDNNLDDESLSDTDIIKAMVKNPVLIERPIVIKGKKAVIGRPPENVLSII